VPPSAIEASAPPPDLSLRHRFTLRLQVVDRYGLPVADARMFVAPRLCGFGIVDGATDARGRLEFSCSGRRDSIELWVAVMAFGTVEPLHVVTLVAGQPLPLAVAVRGRAHEPTQLVELLDAGAPPERLHDVAKEQRARRDAPRQGALQRFDELDTLCGRQLLLTREIACLSCHRPSQVSAYESLRWAPKLTPSLHILARFSDLLLDPPDLTTRAPRRENRRDDDAGQVQRLRQEHGQDHVGFVAGRVRAQTGEAVVGVPVAWLTADGAVRSRTHSGPDGAFRLPVGSDAPCTVVAAGGGLGRSEALLVAPGAGTAPHDFLLRPAMTVVGQAMDAAGAALAGWDVTFDGLDEPGSALATTGDDGSYALSHLPRSGRCLLWPKDQDLRLPVVAPDPALPDARVDLRLSVPTRARLRVHPRLPPGYEHRKVELRIVQVATGRGAHMLVSRFDSAFELEGLAPGFYRGELGAQGLGWIEFGPVHLDGRGLWDLGPIELQLPGVVRLVDAGGAPPPDSFAPSFYRRRDDTDVLVRAHVLGPGRVELPAGDYAMLWRAGGKRRGSQTVRATAGEESVVVVVD
jgi:hypothetical protein